MMIKAGNISYEMVNGSELWYLNGKRHRDVGPAITYSDGGEEWYLNGKLIRREG